MECVSQYEGITEQLSYSIKEKIIYAKKNFNKYFDMAKYITERMQNDHSGKWGSYVIERGKGNGFITYIDKCYFCCYYEGLYFQVYKIRE